MNGRMGGEAQQKRLGTRGRKMDFCTGSGGNIKFITFPNNGGERKDHRLFSADNVHSGSLNGGFN